MKKIFLITLFLIVPFAVNAATFRFEMPTGTIAAGDAFSVRAVLDTDQPVNAYDIHVSFSGPVALQNATNASSVISIWQAPPDTSHPGEVNFKGGSFEPWSGVGGTLFTLNVSASATGTAKFLFHDSNIYLANGKGTKVTPPAASGTLAVTRSAVSGAQAAPVLINAVVDTVPPNIISLSFTADPFSPGQRLLGFSVNDSVSGVRSVEARWRSGLSWNDWQTVQNPTAVPPGAWEVDLRVEDNAGNIAEGVAYDFGALAVPVVVLAIVVLVIVGGLLWKKRRHG